MDKLHEIKAIVGVSAYKVILEAYHEFEQTIFTERKFYFALEKVIPYLELNKMLNAGQKHSLYNHLKLGNWQDCMASLKRNCTIMSAIGLQQKEVIRGH